MGLFILFGTFVHWRQLHINTHNSLVHPYILKRRFCSWQKPIIINIKTITNYVSIITYPRWNSPWPIIGPWPNTVNRPFWKLAIAAYHYTIMHMHTRLLCSRQPYTYNIIYTVRADIIRTNHAPIWFTGVFRYYILNSKNVMEILQCSVRTSRKNVSGRIRYLLFNVYTLRAKAEITIVCRQNLLFPDSTGRKYI